MEKGIKQTPINKNKKKKRNKKEIKKGRNPHDNGRSPANPQIQILLSIFLYGRHEQPQSTELAPAHEAASASPGSSWGAATGLSRKKQGLRSNYGEKRKGGGGENVSEPVQSLILQHPIWLNQPPLTL